MKHLSMALICAPLALAAEDGPSRVELAAELLQCSAYHQMEADLLMIDAGTPDLMGPDPKADLFMVGVMIMRGEDPADQAALIDQVVAEGNAILAAFWQDFNRDQNTTRFRGDWRMEEKLAGCAGHLDALDRAIGNPG